MARVSSWAIQLRLLDRAQLAMSPFDLAVIDQVTHPATASSPT